ncbi:hypothetical protein EDD68_10289 [Melghiribacillus thermohalophilus]|uniref:Uncharacterized protein n=1 Tax=Melghiribacillus thermohalophilus TaxID=1324956 RepID=A0A4R3NGS5_9BACI|nr:hypothetical protein [Melghiribacillus thermohalophilus]TCT26387.1 hypothetical protein EDD68_10289 [Melghiribacillus thermohalophilus]
MRQNESLSLVFIIARSEPMVNAEIDPDCLLLSQAADLLYDLDERCLFTDEVKSNIPLNHGR